MELLGASVTPTYENVDLSKLHRAMDEVQQADSIQTVDDNTIRELLKHPVVQQHIESSETARTSPSKQARQTRGRQPQTRTTRRKDIKTNAYMDGLESFL